MTSRSQSLRTFPRDVQTNLPCRISSRASAIASRIVRGSFLPGRFRDRIFAMLQS